MGRVRDASNGGRGGRGRGGRDRNTSNVVPRKATDLGACKELEGHIFTIGSGNKGKDGDMLRTSKEKMATYIGTKYGDDAAQEWISEKKIVLPEPVHSPFILTRHAERVNATKDRITRKLSSLRTEQVAIETEISSDPSNRALMREKREIDDQILKGEIELKDEVEMKLTEDEKISHANAWRTHRECTDNLKKNRGKVYSLLLGQCTQVLIDKMKQDNDWVTVSTSFDPIALIKLVEKFVLKQSDNQYKIAVVIAEQLSILTFRQEDQVSNATYYDRFTTRVEVGRQTGVCYHTPELLKNKAVELGLGAYEGLMQNDKDTVVEVVEQEYLAYLFINNSNAKMHNQLKKEVANDYSKGNIHAYPSDIHKALTLMNEYKPLKLETAVVPSQGTAFVTDSSKSKKVDGITKYYSDAEWKAMSSEAQSKVINARKKASKHDEDDSDGDTVASEKSTKTIKSLSKTNRSLQKENRKLKKSVMALQKRDSEDDDDSLSSAEEGSSHFQKGLDMLEGSHPKVVLALKERNSVGLDLRNVLLLDNQSTFDLCCNPKFTASIKTSPKALAMMSNGGGMKITQKCRIPGYKFWVWFSNKAITNIICLKNLIKLYRVTYDSEAGTTFVVHRSECGLPDLLFEMHPCGLHVCYPKKMGEFGFIQTVKDNMKLFTKRQIAGAVRAKELYEKMVFPSTEDFRTIVRTGGITGLDVTPDDVKTAEVIWGRSVLKMKGNMVRHDGKRMTQSIVKIPTELIRLQQNVELAIDCFFINKHAFFTTYSTKICFTTVTHIESRGKDLLWVAFYNIYNMYLLRGFRILVVSGDQEFTSITDRVTHLPTTPKVNWAAASEHCGLVERNIRFLKEKIRSVRHSLPFERIPGIMVVRMALHVVKFINGFPRRGGLQHYSPGEIMTERRLHKNDLALRFGTYCQIAENGEPRNSLAPRTRGAISLGTSGNLSGGQVFLTLDTAQTVVRHQWVELPMPAEVIARVNFLGKQEPSMLTFTNRRGEDIGEHIYDGLAGNSTNDGSIPESPIGGNAGVSSDLHLDVLPGADTDFACEPTGVEDDFVSEPTGVEDDSNYCIPQDNQYDEQTNGYGLENEPADTIEAVTPENAPDELVDSMEGEVRRSKRVTSKPSNYIPSMTGKKYEVVQAQMTELLGGTKAAAHLAQQSVMLMTSGVHRVPDSVGLIMAQVSMKAAIKKWGEAANIAITAEMKQLHWRESYKPKHWHELTEKERTCILESHVFVEEKRDGRLKAREVIGGNKQRDYITKEESSSPTVSTEAVILTCVIDALEDRDVAVVDIPNAFAQTVVEEEDAEHRVIVRIRGPLVDILVNVAPGVYGPYVSYNKGGQKVLLVQCLNALYGTMVASLLYYKKFVKSLINHGFKLNPYDGCVANKVEKGKQITICFHVDDCKISHESPEVVDKTIEWLRSEYESIFEDGSGAMKVSRGKIHKYLGMSLDFTHKRECHVSMYDYLQEILETFDLASKEHGDKNASAKNKSIKKSAAPHNLFIVNEDCEKVPSKVGAVFHTIVAKMLYVTKRARPDTSLAVAFLTTRVRAPDTDDWEKLCHLMEYLRGDLQRPLVLGADSDGILMWYVDASFAVHPNMRSHTGGGLTMGRGFPIVVSTKQKLNTRSSTESELIAVDDVMPIILWTRNFLLEQGYGVIENLLLQDNKSAILLEKNGRKSSGKRTRHVNIRYFFITDRINMKEISVEWCPTKDMVADFMTKPLQGSHFRKLRDYIMGRVKSSKPKEDVSDVGMKMNK